MKKFIQVSLLLSLAFASFAERLNSNQEKDGTQVLNHYTIQTTGFNSSISYDGNALLKLSFFNLNGTPIKFQLQQDGITLLSAKYKVISVNQGFDLSQLPAGLYTIRLVQDHQIIERAILKKTQATIFE